jgi:hypothetical protein
MPVTVARTVFARSNAGIVDSKPTRDMDVRVFILCFCCFVCRKRPCDELIPRPRRPTDCVLNKKLKECGQGPKGCRAIENERNYYICLYCLHPLVYYYTVLLYDRQQEIRNIVYIFVTCFDPAGSSSGNIHETYYQLLNCVSNVECNEIYIYDH